MKKPFLWAVVLILFVVLPSAGIGFFVRGGESLWFGLAFLGSLGSAVVLLLGIKDLRSLEKSFKNTQNSCDDQVEELVEMRNLHDETQTHQVELSGEIVHFIGGGAKISRDSMEALARMDEFNIAVSGAARDVHNIDSSLDDLNQGMQTIASATEQTSAATEEMSASIDRISQVSSERYGEIKDVVEIAQRGQKEMTQMVSVIRQITGGIDNLHGFIEVIDDIAGRTSILSMNAAIQAAHAGEAGRGFAVVADEIRKLADSSAKNAASISQRLKELIDGIRKAEVASEATARNFATTEEKVRRASDSFLEIEHGTRELAIGGREILEAVISLRENSIGMRENSGQIVSASEHLRSSVEKLQAESQNLLGRIDEIRKNSADVNFNALTVAQSNVAQMRILSKISSGVAQDFAIKTSSLALQHKSWVARVRASLDGRLNLEPTLASDVAHCELSLWLEGMGRASFKDPAAYDQVVAEHEKLHNLAAETLNQHQDGLRHQGEETFSRLIESSELLVDLISRLSETVGQAVPPLIEWSQTFSLNHPTIDPQHRRLVDLINELHESIRLGKGKDVLGTVLDELISYTDYHFKDEEKLFLASEYPTKDDHLKQHRNFVKKISDLRNAFVSGSAVLGTDTLTFLKEWLIHHIQGTDRGYRSYLG